MKTMKIAEIEVGKSYKLNRRIQFYNHRAGMFANFDDGLTVEVYQKNEDYHTQTVLVKFPGATIEVYPSDLEVIR